MADVGWDLDGKERDDDGKGWDACVYVVVGLGFGFKNFLGVVSLHINYDIIYRCVSPGSMVIK